MSWLRSLKNFFTAAPDAPISRARAMLAADQAALAREIEKTFDLYDERLKDLAGRVNQLSTKDFKREAKNIREAQDGLRRALRRLDLSAKTAKELERELALWEDREQDAAPMHADHPFVRAEMARSELAVRKGKIERARKEIISQTVTVLEEPQSHSTHDELPTTNEPLPLPDTANLLRAIREATREAERWHAIPVEDHDEDALIQVHQVRDLHAALRRMDREQGSQRDRLELAINPREFR